MKRKASDPTSVTGITPLTFPKSLVLPQKSQASQYAELINARVQALNAKAVQLGMGFGISMLEFDLDPAEAPQPGYEALLLLSRLLTNRQYLSLERRDGSWGVYFTDVPSPLDARRPRTVLPILEAPLAAREKFLLRAEEFFKAYIARCQGEIGGLKSALDAADRALAMLNNLQLTE